MPRPFRIPSWLVVAVLGVMYGAYLLPLPDPLRAWSVNLCWLAIIVLAALESGLRAAAEPWARRAWILFSASQALVTLQALSVLLHLAPSGIQMARPPQAGLLLLVLAVALMAGAALALGQAAQARRVGREAALDGLIFALALYGLLWMTVIKPLHPALLAPGVFWIVQLVFVTLAVAVGLTSHALSARELSLRSPVGVLTLAMVYFALVVPFWVRAVFMPGFHLLHPVRMAVFPGFFLTLLAARAPWPERRGNSGRQLFLLLLPYLPAVLAYAGALASYLPRGADRDGLGIGLLGVLALLLLARQGLAMRQIWDMNRTLEHKVEQRTQELQASQSLVARTQQLNLIASLGAGLAHDVNNLLGGALNYLELISEVQDLEPSTRGDLERVAAAVAKAGALTRRTMSIGREESELAEHLDLAAHLRELEPVLRALVPRSIRLQVSAPEAVDTAITRSALDQVLVNLVLNARDATPAGGAIRISVEREGGFALLAVADSGSGIPPEVLERIFDPFFTTKAPGKGTGLGLGSVKAVVEAIGGRIEIRTEVGSGSTFRVLLRSA